VFAPKYNVHAGTASPQRVIGLHGWGGHDAHHELWAERLMSRGSVAVIVDSFGSRGFGNIRKETTAVTPEMRVSDILWDSGVSATDSICRERSDRPSGVFTRRLDNHESGTGEV
jgi:dienelactone hydrolase